MKAIVKPASKPVLFKDVVPQEKDRRSAATNLFLKSLILAQEGKVELSQEAKTGDQRHNLAFPDLAIRCLN